MGARFHYVLTLTLPRGQRVTAVGTTTVLPGATRSAVLDDLMRQMAEDLGCGPRQLIVDFFSLERDELGVV
ncbi:hypothetical protein GCM10027294_32730 [Marinactinospora endophytica]